jgi:hypothetical protein
MTTLAIVAGLVAAFVMAYGLYCLLHIEGEPKDPATGLKRDL